MAKQAGVKPQRTRKELKEIIEYYIDRHYKQGDIATILGLHPVKVCRLHSSHYASTTISLSAPATQTGDFTVFVYWGNEHSDTANDKGALSSDNSSSTKNSVTTASSYYFYGDKTYTLSFYPYIKMSWENVQGTRSFANVLSQWKSTMELYDYYKV